jgi:hypothetical protein
MLVLSKNSDGVVDWHSSDSSVDVLACKVYRMRNEGWTLMSVLSSVLVFEVGQCMLFAMLNGGDYLPMANVVHLIHRSHAWMWVSNGPVQCSLHFESRSSSPDGGKGLEICESRIQG